MHASLCYQDSSRSSLESSSEVTSMGKQDRRHSPKMKRAEQQRKLKARQKRQAEARREQRRNAVKAPEA